VTSGARKADGHPAVPMSAEQIARLQSDVDELASQFFDLVAASRGLTVDAVSKLEAGVFLGQAGVASRLADAVGGMSDAMALLDSKARKGSQMFAAVRPKGNKIMNESPEVLISVGDHTAAVEAAVAGALAKAATEHAAAISALQSASVGLSADLAASRVDLDAAKAKLASLDAARLASKVDALVGHKAGITPASRDKWLALASANEESFDAIVAEMPAGVIGAQVVPAVDAPRVSASEDANVDRINRLTDERQSKNPGEPRHVAMRVVMSANPELCARS
jgi:hypothetical protein